MAGTMSPSTSWPRAMGSAPVMVSSNPMSGVVLPSPWANARVMSAHVAERVGYLFLGIGVAARARGERIASIDLDEVVAAAESD